MLHTCLIIGIVCGAAWPEPPPPVTTNDRHTRGAAQPDSAINGERDASSAPGPLPATTSAVSREFTVFNGPFVRPPVPSVTMREFTVFNFQTIPVDPGDAFSREFTLHLVFDCNDNGIPDDQELINGSADDCNHNFVPDECDIADCDPAAPMEVFFACDDCNNNGRPDACDIPVADGGFCSVDCSADEDDNGKPDECVDYIGDCPDNNDWNCVDNWELASMTEYPDLGMFGGPFNVVLDNINNVGGADDVFLNVDARINSLVVREGAVLSVTNDSGLAGDLSFEDMGVNNGIFLAGDLIIGGGRRIDLAFGDMIIAEGGRYGKPGGFAPPPGPVSDGELADVGNLVVLEGACGAQGQLGMTSDMSASAGSMNIDGGGDDGPDVGCCPGDWNVVDAAEMTVTGDLTINGPGAPSGPFIDGGIVYASSEPLLLGGNFVNSSVVPGIFDWLDGGLTLNGTMPQEFEVAGRDVGAFPTGYGDNFAMGDLTVAAGANVQFVDRLDNDGLGQGPCTEALYVKNLVLEAGSTITLGDPKLGGVNIYYFTLDDQGGTINDVDCAIMPIQVTPAQPYPQGIADCADLDNDGQRDDPCMWWMVGPDGICESQPLVYADLGGGNGACQPDGAADGNDRFHALNCFSNQNTLAVPGYPCEADPPGAYNVDAAGAGTPCTADGVCDANDAFAAINAFDGSTTCSCNPPGMGPLPHAPTGASKESPLKVILVPDRKRVSPGSLLQVDVLLKTPTADLRGYQLHLAPAAGSVADLTVTDIAVRSDKRHAFAGRPFWRAFNRESAQMTAGLQQPGIATPSGAYLATYTFRVAKTARDHAAIELLHDRTDGSQRTFLFGTPEGMVLPVSSSTLRVEIRQP